MRSIGRNHPWYPPHRRHPFPTHPRIQKHPRPWEGQTLRRHCQARCRMAQIRQVRPMPAMHVTRRLQSCEISHPRNVLAIAKRVDRTGPRGPGPHHAQVLCAVRDQGQGSIPGWQEEDMEGAAIVFWPSQVGGFERFRPQVIEDYLYLFNFRTLLSYITLYPIVVAVDYCFVVNAVGFI